MFDSKNALHLPQNLTDARDTGVVEQLAIAIDRLLHIDKEGLMSMLYRLDVQEIALQQAFNQHEHPAMAIAHLVLKRQIQRLQTKAKYHQPNLEDSDIPAW